MEKDFNELTGKTIVLIKGLKSDSNEVIFICNDCSVYRMYHEQDCCESVEINDVCGDVEDLLYTPVLKAEVRTNVDVPPVDEWEESYTWTFYELATIKGSVTIRWYGCSNGYYSESVDFIKMDKEDAKQMIIDSFDDSFCKEFLDNL